MVCRAPVCWVDAVHLSPIGSLLILLLGSFDAQKLVILVKPNLSMFSFVACATSAESLEHHCNKEVHLSTMNLPAPFTKSRALEPRAVNSP